MARKRTPKNSQITRNNAVDKRLSSKASVLYGDIYRDPHNSKQMYAYLGNKDSVSGYALNLQSKEHVPINQIEHIFQDANKIGANITEGVLFGEPNNKALMAVQESNAARLYEKKILIDFETIVADSRQIKNYSDIKEIAFRQMSGDQTTRAVSSAKTGSDIRVSENKQLSIIMNMSNKADASGSGGMSMSRIYETAKKRGIKKTNYGAGSFKLGADKNITSNRIIMGNDMLNALEPGKKMHKWFSEYMGQTGNDAAFLFESDLGQEKTKNMLNKVFKDMADVTNKGTTRFYGANSKNFDQIITERFANAKVPMSDIREGATLMYSHLFPEPSEGLLNYVNTQYAPLKKVSAEGKEVMENVMGTFGRGFRSDFAPATNVQTMYNVLVNNIQNGTDTLTMEFHQGLADTALEEKLAKIVENPREFSKVAKNRYKPWGFSTRQGMLHDLIRYQFAEKSTFNDELFKSSHAKNDFSGVQKIYKRYLSIFDDAINPNKIEAKYKVNLESIIDRHVGKNDSWHKKSISTLGGSGIANLLGGAALVAGVHATVEKLGKWRDRISATEDKEGLSHNSLLTTIRRLSMTDFGSGWRGFTGSLIKNFAKTFMGKGNRQASSEFIKFINSSWKSNPASLLRVKSIRESVRYSGRILQHDVVKNPGMILKNIGKGLESIGTPGFMKQKMKMITDGLKNLTSEGPAKLDFKKAKTILPWIGIGAAAAVGVNMLAGTYYGEMEYPKFQDTTPQDTYQKEAFRNMDHLLNQRKKETLSAGLRLRNKGIDNRNVSPYRMANRYGLTDFASKHRLFSPTSYAISNISVATQGVHRSRREMTGILGYMESQEMKNTQRNAHSRASKRVHEIEAVVSNRNREENTNIVNNIRDMYRNDYNDSRLPESELKLILEFAQDSGQSYFDSNMLSEQPAVPIEFTIPGSFENRSTIQTQVDHSNDGTSMRDRSTMDYATKSMMTRRGSTYKDMPLINDRVRAVKGTFIRPDSDTLYNTNNTNAVKHSYTISSPHRNHKAVDRTKLVDSSPLNRDELIVPTQFGRFGSFVSESKIDAINKQSDILTSINPGNAPTIYTGVQSLNRIPESARESSLMLSSSNSYTRDYDKIESWDPGPINTGSTHMQQLNMNDVSSMTIDHGNSPMGHTRESNYAGRDFDVLKVI